MRKQMSRRDFLRLSAALATGAVAASCAPATPKIVEVEREVPVEKVVVQTVEVEKVVEKEVTPKPPTPGPFTLVGWTVHGMDPGVEKYKPYREAILSCLHDKHPNATFKHEDMGWDEKLRRNLMMALMAGTEPDIVVGENFIKPFAAKGAFLPFDDEIAPIKDDLIHGAYAASEYGGHVYGISQFTSCFGFERNPNVIEKAGLDPEKPPETWNELIEQCAKITEAGKGEYYGYTMQGPKGFLIGGILRFALYAKTAGAELAKGEPPMPWFDNPKLEKVWQFYRDLLPYTPPGLVWNPNEGQVYSELFKGRVAYQPCGSWHIKWAKDVGLKNAMYSWVPIPDEDGVKATGVVGNVILSVLSRTKHPDAAIDFCMCFLEDKAQDMVGPIFGRYPSTRSGLKRYSEAVGKDAPEQVFIDMLLNADLGILPQWHTNPNEVWTVFNELFAKVLETDEPIPKLMAEAQEKAMAAIKA